jgi:hypothetical protein
VKGFVPILEGILNFGKKHLGRIGFGKDYDYGKKHEAIEDLPRNLQFRKETRCEIDFGKKLEGGARW